MFIVLKLHWTDYRLRRNQLNWFQIRYQNHTAIVLPHANTNDTVCIEQIWFTPVSKHLQHICMSNVRSVHCSVFIAKIIIVITMELYTVYGTVKRYAREIWIDALEQRQHRAQRPSFDKNRSARPQFWAAATVVVVVFLTHFSYSPHTIDCIVYITRIYASVCTCICVANKLGQFSGLNDASNSFSGHSFKPRIKFLFWNKNPPFNNLLISTFVHSAEE